MSSNPNNKGKGGGQGPRKRGFIFGAILWALVLVIFFNFLAKQIANAGTKEVPYSEFIQMVEEDKVATVELTSNKYTFYLKEDLPAGAGEGGSQDLAEVLAQQMEQGGATRYVTAPVVARDDSQMCIRDRVMTRSSRGPLQKLGSVATYVVRNAQFLDLIIMREAAP